MAVFYCSNEDKLHYNLTQLNNKLDSLEKSIYNLLDEKMPVNWSSNYFFDGMRETYDARRKVYSLVKQLEKSGTTYDDCRTNSLVVSFCSKTENTLDFVDKLVNDIHHLEFSNLSVDDILNEYVKIYQRDIAATYGKLADEQPDLFFRISSVMQSADEMFKSKDMETNSVNKESLEME